MKLSEHVVDRSVQPARDRAEQEVRSLIAAAHAVLRRSGGSGLTVADVLAEAGLSTRAFYRHFASKDELVLAVFEREQESATTRLMAKIDAAADPRAALAAWVDETLALAYEPRRAGRTQVLWSEGARLRAEFPTEFDAIVGGLLEPLVAILRAGAADGEFPLTDPEADAASIHAVVWNAVQRKLDGAPVPTRAATRAQLLRFCLGALGADTTVPTGPDPTNAIDHPTPAASDPKGVESTL
ncbi:MAG: putative TetR family transcriptional regulator [Actinomycetia bacterium]|nr:putative TetR family transcriptional regulator [Actinomycetes bacterium]